MCQYMAADGCVNDWHVIHIGSFASGGFGLITMEATAVLPEGRITPHCLGLWNDAQEHALARILHRVRAVSNVPLGIQLAHAGRKASTSRPFLHESGGRASRGTIPLDAGGWTTVAPSPIAFGELRAPHEMDATALDELSRAYIQSAVRAARLGFEYCELHMAHGYLLASFLSPLSNRRRDAYGGSLERRMRFPLETVERVRAVWPHDRPLGVRFGGADPIDGGWTIDDAAAFGVELAARGVDVLSVSTAGNAAVHQPSSPGWLVPHARAVRAAIHGAVPVGAGGAGEHRDVAANGARPTNTAVFAVGELDDPALAERTIAEGSADVVLLARGALRDPRFPWRAARALGAVPPCPAPYAWAVGG